MVILMKLHFNKQSINKQKKIYLIFISIITISIILGFLFYFIISDGNKELVITTQKSFFNNISSNNIKYLNSFINSILSNFMYISLIFILGLSIIGFIFIIGIVIFKSFILGFSISSIIGTFGIKGVVLSLLYIFPHQILFLILLLLMCFYSCSFCYKLFKHLFLRSIINFRKLKDKYLKIYVICLIGSLICSTYEVFIIPWLIDIFI